MRQADFVRFVAVDVLLLVFGRSGYVLQDITAPMFCVRLCPVDNGRRAFPPLSGVSDAKSKNIIDRLRSILAFSLVRDAAGPSGVEAACRMRVVGR